MTTILTRLYRSHPAARAVQDRLYRAGFPRHVMRVIALQDGQDASDVTRRIIAARVPEREAAVYAEGVAAGNALLVLEAGYKPLGAASIGRDILRKTDSITCEIESEEAKVRTLPDHAPSILKDHPRFLTAPPDPDFVGGPLSDQLGLLMVVSRRRMNSALKDGGPFLPLSTLIKNRKARSAISGGYYVSRNFWPAKLVSNKPRRRSVIPGGGHPFSRFLGWATVS